MPVFKETFDSPASGNCLEYEMNVYPGVSSTGVDFSFGFLSGDDIILSFSGSAGKLYDNDGNFVFGYSAGISNPIEIYGNIFSSYHNYSINRVPVNLNCSRELSDTIDGFYYDNEEFKFGLIAKDSSENAEEISY